MRNSMRKASSGYFAFCKAHREGQRPRCPIRLRVGNEDVAPPVWLNPARKRLAGCIAFCDSDLCAKLFADGWLNSSAKLLAGCIAFCDSDLCAKLFADGWLNSCAKLSRQISRNHCPTRHTRRTRPTSPSAKREALSPYAASTIGLAVHFQLALRIRMPFSVAMPLR